MKKRFHIGNITKVRWHYRNCKYVLNAWGHMRISFDKDAYISKKYPQLDDENSTELDLTMCITMDTNMVPTKQYAYIEINKENRLIIRNLFDSKHKEGFDQKNAYFRDQLYYDLFLDDTSNLLDMYLKLGNIKRESNNCLYFCVEYEAYNNYMDMELLLYCSELEQVKSSLEDKLRIIEIQTDMKENQPKRRWYSFLK